MKVFESGDVFEGRVKSVDIGRSEVWESGSGRSFFEYSYITVEARFSREVIRRLLETSFLVVEDEDENGGKEYYVYETAGITPYHIQVPIVKDESLPVEIRSEFLEKLWEDWQKDETQKWLNIRAVYTGYKLEFDGENLNFRRVPKVIPLVGSPVYLLTRDVSAKFVGWSGDKAVEIGKIQGLDLPLYVNLENLVRYHLGVFGFTGSGKSNLTSFLIRKILEKLPDTSVVVFDVSGEYLVHLADLVFKNGVFISTESFEDENGKRNVELLLDSQVIPESLGSDGFVEKIKDIFAEVLERRFYPLPKYPSTLYTPKDIIEFLEDPSFLSELTTKQSKDVRNKIVDYISRNFSNEMTTPFSKIFQDKVDKVKEFHNSLSTTIPEAGSKEYLFYDVLWSVKSVLNGLKLLPDIISEVLSNESKNKVFIFYIPEPELARHYVASFIRKTFEFKKKGHRKRVVCVLDEVQEFIPASVKKDDGTAESSRQVEFLARHGRKFRFHLVLASQRLAHLNTSVLAQLQSYFVGSLPRSYDRGVIASAFATNPEIISKCVLLDTGQWLFSSFRAITQKGVHVILQTPNNEEILKHELDRLEVKR